MAYLTGDVLPRKQKALLSVLARELKKRLITLGVFALSMTLPPPSGPNRDVVHTPLATLAQWSVSHIKAVFESASDEESSHAIAATFATDVDATVNGRRVGLAEIKRMVKDLRDGGSSTLRVRWLLGSMVEVPSDASIKAGTFAGVYTISGIKRDNAEPSEEQVERRKVVIARIQSTSDDPTHDSRRIVALTYAASDVEISQRDTSMPNRSFL